MIILDTNVISALMRPDLDAGVVAWLNQQPALLIWTTTINVLEIRTGLLLMPVGRRQGELFARFETLLSDILDDRILAFDRDAAEHAAKITAYHAKVGRNIEVPDNQIAGIALSRNATLATRNTKDFADVGLKLINPWNSKQ